MTQLGWAGTAHLWCCRISLANMRATFSQCRLVGQKSRQELSGTISSTRGKRCSGSTWPFLSLCCVIKTTFMLKMITTENLRVTGYSVNCNACAVSHVSQCPSLIFVCVVVCLWKGLCCSVRLFWSKNKWKWAIQVWNLKPLNLSFLQWHVKLKGFPSKRIALKEDTL